MPVKKDVNALKDQATRLLDDLNNIFETLGTVGKGQSDEMRERIEHEITERLQKISGNFNQWSAQGGKYAKKLEQQVEENPWLSLLAAFGIGVILGKFLDRD